MSIIKKPFWKSKTLWGVLLAAIPGVGGPISAAVLNMPSGDAMPGEIATILAGVGAVLAIYGRYKSTGELSLK